MLARLERTVVQRLTRLSTRVLPFADAASESLPLPRLLRLGLFQVSVGMSAALLTGTLNRVMIVELAVPAWFVGLLISLPLVFAPFRALVGHRSDEHRSVLGWRRVPYIWMGTLLQFGGLAIMPFAVILLTGDKNGSLVPGVLGATTAFLMVGAGIHVTQTAGLALASDLAPAESRPRVVALLYVMLLLGTLVSALGFGVALADYSHTRLAQVIQSAAMIAVICNTASLWKQEARGSRPEAPPVAFRARWREFAQEPSVRRLLAAVGIGAAGFAMQDVLLEPFGGELLGLGVGRTTQLTGLMAAGSLVAFGLAARRIERGGDPLRLAGAGLVAGLFALAGVVFAPPLASPALLAGSSVVLGFASALFLVGTLTTAMGIARADLRGLALGAWGAVQATAAGAAVGLGGLLRDLIAGAAARGWLGPALSGRAAGYVSVFLFEMVLLLVALAVIGPLAGPFGAASADRGRRPRFGLAELPG